MSSLKELASLIMVPSLYKDGELHTVKPLGNSILHPDATGNHDGTDGSTPAEGNFTFSRGSNLAATRVDVNGLIEKGRENLLLQSNQFDTTWAAVGINRTSGQSGYDGTNNAWKIESTNTGQSRLAQTISISGVNTISFYAKAGTANYIVPYIIGSGDPRAFFNLSTGIVGTTAFNIDASMEDVGNGWYRCSMTLERTSSSLWVFIGNTDNNFNSAIGDNIYIQDAQLEAGLVATDYIETGASTAQAGILEDMPRLDYSGSCPALLLEPQRSNFMIQSEYFDIAYNLINVGFDYNNSISPEGLQNAAKVIPTNGATLARVWKGPYGSGSQVASVFAKAGEYDSIYFAVFSGSVYKYAAYNLSNGSLISATADNYGIEDYGNGWYRVWVYLASSTSRYVNLSVGNSTDTIGNVGFEISANGTDGLYIYGYQVELDASYPTSYIPTYGSSVTRSKDSCKNTTITDFQTSDASIFVEFNYDSSKTGTFRYVFSTENSTGSNFDLISLSSTSGGYSFYFNINGSGISFPTLSLLSGKNKALLKFNRTSKEVKSYLNGVEINSATATAIPEIHKIAIGGRLNAYSGFATDRELGDDVSQFTIFPTALTDSECIALTTL
jgi:hypothetical protein